MRAIILSLLLCWPWLELQAFTNFLQNPYTPYPEGCSAAEDWYETSPAIKRFKFHEGRVSLKTPGFPASSTEAVIKAYRFACAEPNRSLILLQFTTPDDKADYFYSAPSIRAVFADGSSVLMSLTWSSPNNWKLETWPASQPFAFGMNNCIGNADFCSATGWTFVLDNRSPLLAGVEADEFLTSDEYNGSFRLELNWSDKSRGYSIEVPATFTEFPEETSIPLSGRLSGLWVIDGAADQGFNIAVSELKGDPYACYPEYCGKNLLHLSWHTFDSLGQPMWLTGAAEFTYPATEVEFPLITVSGGEFLGDKRAVRQVVGQVKVSAQSCNNLAFEYDLSPLGLGVGVTRLNRIFSLELAGHTCRDMGARIAGRRSQ